mmetsp:Transcript_18764/g.46723  ORF Transcript_18764/g.46723 Transcript_18764/m.46723 type:complete len:236 (+) Transcript_18764:69-776(+)
MFFLSESTNSPVAVVASCSLPPAACPADHPAAFSLPRSTVAAAPRTPCAAPLAPSATAAATDPTKLLPASLPDTPPDTPGTPPDTPGTLGTSDAPGTVALGASALSPMTSVAACCLCRSGRSRLAEVRSRSCALSLRPSLNALRAALRARAAVAVASRQFVTPLRTPSSSTALKKADDDDTLPFFFSSTSMMPAAPGEEEVSLDAAAAADATSTLQTPSSSEVADEASFLGGGGA